MVQDATLATDIFTELRTALVAGAITVTSTAGTETATIASSFNDQKTSSPQVIIYPIDQDEGEWKFSSYEGKKLINVPLEIFHKNTHGLDQLHNQVYQIVKENEIDGVELVGITSAYSFTNPELVKYHTKTINLTYDRE